MMEYSLRTRMANSADERKVMHDEMFGRLNIPKTAIAKVADHIELIRDVAGGDALGLGGEFDGNAYWPEGLSNVSMYPILFAELIRRGWSDCDLRKCPGENLLRALEAAEKVAFRLQQEQPASTHGLSLGPPRRRGLRWRSW